MESSLVQTKFGHQEGAEVGYNPVKPGRPSSHPLVGLGAGTRLCAAFRFRSGDSVTATQWQAAMEDAQATLGGRRVWLNRGDLGLGHEAIIAWHEAVPDPPKYLFKFRLTTNVRRALHALPVTAWQGPTKAGVWQVAEARARLRGWSAERRVVFARKLQGGKCGPECLVDRTEMSLFREGVRAQMSVFCPRAQSAAGSAAVVGAEPC